jgi:hypothetical protein
LAPASTVTDELAFGDAEAEEPEPLALDEAVLDDGRADELLLPLLLHAARPVTAARVMIPPRASWGRLLLAVLVLSLFIGENSFDSLFLGRCALRVRAWRLYAKRRAAMGASTTVKDRGGRVRARPCP